MTLKKDQTQVEIRFLIAKVYLMMDNIYQIRDNPTIILKCKMLLQIIFKHKQLILKYPKLDIKNNQKLELVCKINKKRYQMKMSKCKLRISLSLKNNQILKELINHILLIKKNSKLFSLSLKKEERIGGEVSDEILMQLIFLR